MTKPIAGVAALTLVADGSVGLDDAVERWLPELAHPTVMRDPDGSLEDVVPADRPITLRDLLTFTLGVGMDFNRFGRQPWMDAASALELGEGPPRPQVPPPPDEWMRRLATLPLEAQPGQRWLYHLGADVLGVLVAARRRPIARGRADRPGARPARHGRHALPRRTRPHRAVRVRVRHGPGVWRALDVRRGRRSVEPAAGVPVRRCGPGVTDDPRRATVQGRLASAHRDRRDRHRRWHRRATGPAGGSSRARGSMPRADWLRGIGSRLLTRLVQSTHAKRSDEADRQPRRLVPRTSLGCGDPLELHVELAGEAHREVRARRCSSASFARRSTTARSPGSSATRTLVNTNDHVRRAHVLDRPVDDLADLADAVPHLVRDRVDASRSRIERIRLPGGVVVHEDDALARVGGRGDEGLGDRVLADRRVADQVDDRRRERHGAQPTTKLTSLSGTAMTLRTVAPVEQLGDLGVGRGRRPRGRRRTGRRPPRSWPAPCR